MAWFRRPAPEPEPLPSDEELAGQVDEGMLIVAATLRMRLRNQLVVDVLRDGEDLDDAGLARAVRDGIQGLVDEKARSIARLERIGTRAARRSGPAEHGGDYRQRDVGPLALRVRIDELLMDRLAAAALDDAFVADVVRSARRSALDEMVDVVVRQLAMPLPQTPDETRGARLDALRDELAGMRRGRRPRRETRRR